MAPTSIDREVLGDWSNLKGTRYHLVYALWLLLRERVPEVRFYAGNDLHAASVAPPASVPPSADPVPAVAADARRPATDVWIQLKATREPWTASQLLADNLLANFLCNAAVSVHAGRGWDVRLVTEADVRGDEVRAFQADPTAHPRLGDRLQAAVDAAGGRLINQPWFAQDRFDLRATASEVLSRLAASEPTPFRALKAEVEAELALACPERGGRDRLASTLVGAMILDAGAGPAAARTYTPAWANEQAGRPVVPRATFDTDPAGGCDEQVRAALDAPGSTVPDPSSYVPRSLLLSALSRFLEAPEPVFMLVGRGGTGKSAAVARWAADSLAGRRRVLVRRPDLTRHRSVAELVAAALAGLTDRADRPGDLLAALAAAPGATPGVLILDDLLAMVETRDDVSETIARLAAAARDLRLKLVVTCQADPWRVLGLGAEVPPECVFRPDLRTAPDRRAQSFVLDDYTPDELADAVRRAYPGPAGETLGRELAHPAFSALRRPYLLARYLDLDPLSGSASPVDTGRLLDDAADARVRQVAAELSLDEASVAVGLRAAVRRLGGIDPGGRTPADLTRLFDESAPGSGPKVLTGFRRAGVIDASSPAGWADETLGAHLVARAVLGEPNPRELVTRLNPISHAEVVEALVRDAVDGPALGAGLVRKDRRWRAAVSAGLAARSDADPQTLGLLVALTMAYDDRFVDPAGCAGLGFRAARGGRSADARRVWRRAAELYLSADPALQLRGAEALEAAFDVAPARAARYVRHRIAREYRERPRFGRRELGRRLADALRAAHRIEHRAAAEAAAEILRLVEPAERSESLPDQGRLTTAVDDIRGRIVVLGKPEAVAALLTELRAEDRVTRIRAAGALRPVVARAPDLVRTAVLERVLLERDGAVLMRLVWACHPFLPNHAREVVEAVAAGAAGRWDDPVTAGAALSILGDACRYAPAEAAAALPTRLDRLTADERAWFGDVHALAWWQCADHHPPARATLVALRHPGMAGVSDPFRVFAHRGAFVAGVGDALHARRVSGEVVSWMLTRHGEGPPYCYSDLDDLVERHAGELLASAGQAELIDSLLAAIGSYHGVAVNVLDDYFVNARFVPARDSVDDLARLAARTPDPVSVLSRLPRDWEAMRAARRVLAAGVADPEVIAFAARACEEHARTGTAQAHDERGLCLSALAVVEPARGVTEDPAPERRHFLSGGGVDGDRVKRLAALGDEEPDRLLETLETLVCDAEHVPALAGWLGRTRSWAGALLARVFRRMFSPRPLATAHAADLTRDVLAVLDALPASPARAEWATVYRAIHSWLGGRPVPLTVARRPDSIFSTGHAAAAEVLSRSAAVVAAGGTPSFGQADFLDGRLWWQSPNYHVEGDGLRFGFGESFYLIYAMPAVRLAFAAAQSGRVPVDPLGSFMRSRYAAGEALAAVDRAVRFDHASVHEMARHLSAADDLRARFPWDERIDRLRGEPARAAGAVRGRGGCPPAVRRAPAGSPGVAVLGPVRPGVRGRAGGAARRLRARVDGGPTRRAQARVPDRLGPGPGGRAPPGLVRCTSSTPPFRWLTRTRARRSSAGAQI